MLRAIAGIIVGYLIFAVPSFLLFRITGHDPHAPASVALEVSAILCGVVFALLGGYMGTTISGRSAWWVLVGGWLRLRRQESSNDGGLYP